MADITISAALKFARSRFRYIDQTGVTRGFYTGAAQTTSFGGDRVGATIDFTPSGGATTTGKAERAQMLAFLMSLRGKQNRVYVADAANDTGQGTFPATELFSNTDLSGTTSWLTDTKYSLTASDGVLRSSFILQGTTGYPARQTITTTQFAPYASRFVVRQGRGTFSAIYPLLDGSASNGLTSSLGYAVNGMVAQNASGLAGLFDNSTTGLVVGDYIDILFASAARCALVDAGGNLFTKSDELNHADWTKTEATIGTDTQTTPYGTASGDKIIPSTNNASHYVSQTKVVTSAAQDVFLGGVFFADGYNFIRLHIAENTGSTSAVQVFNLNTGAVGATSATGANWSNLRPIIRSMGGGWYYCGLIARKTNAATSISGLFVVQNADNTSTFAGNGTSGVVGGRLTMFPSSSFMELIESTTAAVAASTPTGSALRLKGLPVSTSDLLKIGRWIEIDGQLKMVTSALNSDAAGLGYLQFSPPLRRAASDNLPVIVNRPMGRFLFAGDSPGWDNEPGIISMASIDLEEAFA
jgi:hypothetical protein